MSCLDCRPRAVLVCRDCGLERPDLVRDDWETLEDIPLCAECAGARIDDRGTVPQEWRFEH